MPCSLKRYELVADGIKCNACDSLIVKGKVCTHFMKRIGVHDRTCIIISALKSTRKFDCEMFVATYRGLVSLKAVQPIIEEYFLELPGHSVIEAIKKRLNNDSPNIRAKVVKGLSDRIKERLVQIGINYSVLEASGVDKNPRGIFEKKLFDRCLALDKLKFSKFKWRYMKNTKTWCFTVGVIKFIKSDKYLLHFTKNFESRGDFIIQHYGDLVEANLDLSLEEELELFKYESLSDELYASYHINPEQEEQLKHQSIYRRNKFEPSDLFRTVGAIFKETNRGNRHYLTYGFIQELIPDENDPGQLRAVISMMEDEEGETCVEDNANIHELFFFFDARDMNLHPKRAVDVCCPQENLWLGREPNPKAKKSIQELVASFHLQKKQKICSGSGVKPSDLGDPTPNSIVNDMLEASRMDDTTEPDEESNLEQNQPQNSEETHLAEQADVAQEVEVAEEVDIVKEADVAEEAGVTEAAAVSEDTEAPLDTEVVHEPKIAEEAEIAGVEPGIDMSSVLTLPEEVYRELRLKKLRILPNLELSYSESDGQTKTYIGQLRKSEYNSLYKLCSHDVRAVEVAEVESDVDVYSNFALPEVVRRELRLKKLKLLTNLELCYSQSDGQMKADIDKTLKTEYKCLYRMCKHESIMS